MSCPGCRHILVLIGEKRLLCHWPLCCHLPGVRAGCDTVTLLPRDLKRDVAKKLEKLEKRTQRAIAELIRGLWCCRDGGWGHQEVQRGHTVLTGAREGLVELDPLPKRVCEAVGPK